MNCPQCRFENPQDAQFCTECGAALKSDMKPGILGCPKCGYENKADSAFCINCGASLKAAPQKDILPEPEKIAPEAGPKPELKKTVSARRLKPAKNIDCPQCHSENEEGSAFCIDCGSSLKPVPAARPVDLAPAPKLKPDLKPQAPLAPQAAEPKPAPSLPVEPKLKAELPLPPPPTEPKLKAAPATPPSPKKEPPAPASDTELTETWRVPKKAAPPRATSSGRQKIEQPVPASESAFPTAELPVVEKTSEPSKPRKWLLPAGVAAALAVICLAVWYFALRPKPSARPAVQLSMPAETVPQAAPAAAPADASPSIPPAQTQAQPPAEKESVSAAVQPTAVPPPPVENKQASATPQPSAPPHPAKSAARPTADISEQITLGIEAFQQKDYDECIKQMKAALSQDPANKTARRYLADAERTRKEGREIASLLQAAGEAYQAGSFEQCLEQTKKILALDPGQAEALRFEEMAHQKLAPQRIKSLVDQFTVAVNGGQLLSYYETACLPALFQKIKRDVELMNGIYGQFKSQSSQTTIRFLDNGLIEARFSNITTGQLKTDNRRMIIFEGTYVWTLQRQGDRWMIAGLQSQPLRKKT